MAFDPDQYLADKAKAPAAGFDPDAYLATKATPSEPGIPEALARGAANGLTLGAEPVIAGGFDALKKAIMSGQISLDDLSKNYTQGRKEALDNNEAASNAHPVASFAGNIVGGLPLAALTGGASEGVGAGEAALRAGSLLGAGSGLGNSLAQGKDASDTLKSTIEGAGEGAATGALLHGVVGAGKFVGNKIADSDTWNNFANAIKHSMDGVKVTGKSAGEGIRNMVGDAAEALGTGLRDENKTQGATLGGLRAGAQAEGKTINTSKVVDGLKAAIDKLNKSADPDAATDAAYLQKYLDNLVLGKDSIDVPVSRIIPEKTIPGTPSGQDKIETALSRLEAKENALPKGVQTSVVPSADNSGNSFLNILKETPGEEEGYPNQSITNTLPNTPGTPDTIVPKSLSTPKMQQIRAGAIDADATPFDNANQIKQTLTRFSGNAGNNSPLKTNDAINAMSALAKGMNNDIIQAPAGGIGPATELGQATKNSQLSYSALKELGLDDSDFEKNPITGEMELTSDAERSLKNKVRQLGTGNDTPSGQNASDVLKSSLDYLRQLNPDKANTIQQQVERAGEINNLYRMGQGANFSRSSILRTAPVQVGSFIGSGLKSSGVADAANLAGNVISKVAKGISKTDIAQGAKSLLANGSPNQMKLAQILGESLNSPSDTARNATIFSLMQQPGYRELLKQHIPGLSDDEGNNPPQE